MSTQNYGLPLKIKMLRLNSGKSQEEFANLLGISRSCLANYETGKRRPDNQMISKIATACNVVTDFLMEKTRIPRYALGETKPSYYKKHNTKQANSLIQNRGNSLDISALSVEHKISMLEYYDYILSKQNKENEI